MSEPADHTGRETAMPSDALFRTVSMDVFGLESRVGTVLRQLPHGGVLVRPGTTALLLPRTR